MLARTVARRPEAVAWPAFHRISVTLAFLDAAPPGPDRVASIAVDVHGLLLAMLMTMWARSMAAISI
jgi:hypothetical protein